MGTFTLPIQVGDLAGQQFVDLEALVDTGATYTSIPGSTLDRLGIEIRESRSFELADERIVEYSVGYASIRLEEREIIAMVVFAPQGPAPRWGATAVDTAGFGLYPQHMRLMPDPAVDDPLVDGRSGAIRTE